MEKILDWAPKSYGAYAFGVAMITSEGPALRSNESKRPMFDFSVIVDPARNACGPISVNAPDRHLLLSDLEAKLVSGQGFSLATINLDHLVKLRRDPVFRAAYAAHTHITADGNPIVWLCRLAGQKVSLLPGSELVEPVAALAARHGVPVAMVGSTKDSLEGAAECLAARHSGIALVTGIAPHMGFEPIGPSGDAVIEDLRASGARLCFIALGAPKQEIFVARARAALPEVGFLSIGAGLDFLSGAQNRAPLWIRRLALEWLWRVAVSPRRLFWRYASCFAILPLGVKAALKVRYDSHQSQPATPIDKSGERKT